MLIEFMVTHETSIKKIFESNFKNKNNIVFLYTSSSMLESDEWLIDSHLM
jgi:hypothetical protein